MRKIVLLTFLLTGGITPTLLKAQQTDPAPADVSASEHSTVSSGGNGSAINDIFSVDHYTGTAALGIPIYSYSINGLDLGVSLSYDMRGIRVDQTESSIGLGWSLSTGGKITREVRGIEDETVIKPVGPYGSYSDKKIQKYRGIWAQYAGEESEKEHDLFTLNFCGRTFKFNYEHIKTWNNQWINMAYTLPKANIKIEMGADNPLQGGTADQYENSDIVNFTVTDELNNKYYFKRGDYEEKHYTVPNVNDEYIYYPPTSWDLVKIVTNTGTEINYTYGYATVDYAQYKSEKIHERYEDISWPATMEPKGLYVNENKFVRWKGKISYLQKIEYPNGTTVSFIYNSFTDWKVGPVLDKIAISSQYDNNLKNKWTYKLNQAYFQTPWRTHMGNEISLMSRADIALALNEPEADSVNAHIDLGLRLKLKGIVKVDENDNTEPYYSFEYNNTNLPRRLSPSKDYYGFYNGKQPMFIPSGIQTAARPELEAMAVPFHSTHGMNTQDLCSYGTDKTPDISFAKAWVLQKVTNGLGGTLSFTFKDHSLSNPANGYLGENIYNTPGQYPSYEGQQANDGLCIDEIAMVDGYNLNNNVKVKYEFADGQRFFRGGLLWSPYPWPLSTESRIYYNAFVSPICYIRGANHGYSYVEEKRYGFNNQLIGSTKYHFTNLVYNNGDKSNLSMEKEMKYYARPVKYMYESRMGIPIDITTYDHNGLALGKTEFSYLDSVGKTGHYYSWDNRDPISESIYHDFYNYPYRLGHKKTITYTNNGNFIKDIDYTYNENGDLTKISWLDDRGVLTRKVTDYITYIETTQDVYGNPVYTTKSTSRPAGVSLVNEYSGGLSQLLLDCSYNEVAANLPYLPLKIHKLRGIPLIGTTSYVAVENQLFDAKNNVLQSRLDEQEFYSSSVWDTRIGKQIAAVSSAKYEDIAYTSFEGAFKPFGTADDNKGNWDFDNSSIQYVAPAAASQPMTGRYYYQLYGGRLRSKNALASGKSYIVTCWATNPPTMALGNTGSLPGIPSGLTFPAQEEMQVGQWKLYSYRITGYGTSISMTANNSTLVDELRLYPADAAMTTTTYEPLWGPNSQSDERGNIRYFEYDAFGRPTVVRDINRNILSVSRQVVQGADN